MFNGAKVWNELPNQIKSTESKNDFKSKCKMYLFKKMQDKERSDFVM